MNQDPVIPQSACPCGHVFAPSDDGADGVIRCPECGRLKNNARVDAASGPVELAPSSELPRLGPSAAPIPFAKPALQYTTLVATPGYGPREIFVDLWGYSNLFVMGFILLFHLVLLVAVLLMSLLFINMLLVPVFVLWPALVAHYGNVIDDTGPNGRDELPTPLRNLNWGDDLWGPFLAMAVGLIVCYWPVVVALQLPLNDIPRYALAVLLAVAGSQFAPAALLTTATSGSWINLRPDRVYGLIVACGWRYTAAVVTWVVTVAVYGMGIYHTTLLAVNWQQQITFPWWNWIASMGLLVAGIFLMHFFCWQLGQLYRTCYDGFPWVLQRHVKVERDKPRPTNQTEPSPVVQEKPLP